jgi:hypothetical protein
MAMCQKLKTTNTNIIIMVSKVHSNNYEQVLLSLSLYSIPIRHEGADEGSSVALLIYASDLICGTTPPDGQTETLAQRHAAFLGNRVSLCSIGGVSDAV